MPSRRQRPEMTPEQLLEQLRLMLSDYEPATSTPPPFEPMVDEPEPWSVPPPDGFDELRSSLGRG